MSRMGKLVRCLDEDVKSSTGVIVTARGPFGPDRIRGTVAKSYCSIAGTVAAAQYFPEADQVK